MFEKVKKKKAGNSISNKANKVRFPTGGQHQLGAFPNPRSRKEPINTRQSAHVCAYDHGVWTGVCVCSHEWAPRRRRGSGDCLEQRLQSGVVGGPL